MQGREKLEMSAILSYSCSRPIFPREDIWQYPRPQSMAPLVGMKKSYGALKESGPLPAVVSVRNPGLSSASFREEVVCPEERQPPRASSETSTKGSLPIQSQFGEEGGTHGPPTERTNLRAGDGR